MLVLNIIYKPFIIGAPSRVPCVFVLAHVCGAPSSKQFNSAQAMRVGTLGTCDSRKRASDYPVPLCARQCAMYCNPKAPAAATSNGTAALACV